MSLLVIHEAYVPVHKGRRRKKLFFYFRSKGGGGLGQTKKSLSENTQIFLTKGGGLSDRLTQFKRVLSDFLA